MGVMEIILITVGMVVLIISFVIPAGKPEQDMEQAPVPDERMIRALVEKEIDGAKSHIRDMVDETLTYSMEKTERAMERLTNEKIMAVNEYSEQVLAAINKNHQEVMFLYDMLNDKHENLVNTVSEASKKAKEIKQTVQDAEITVKEAVEMMAEDTEAVTGNNAGAEAAAGQPAAGQSAAGQPASPAGDAGQEAEHAVMPEGETAGEAEFIPMAPKRVEALHGAIQETEGPTAAGAEEPVPEEEKNHNNNEKILRLHKLGKSKTAIAKELGLGVGEVKLVIDLFEQG